MALKDIADIARTRGAWTLFYWAEGEAGIGTRDLGSKDDVRSFGNTQSPRKLSDAVFENTSGTPRKMDVPFDLALFGRLTYLAKVQEMDNRGKPVFIPGERKKGLLGLLGIREQKPVFERKYVPYTLFELTDVESEEEAHGLQMAIRVSKPGRAVNMPSLNVVSGKAEIARIVEYLKARSSDFYPLIRELVSRERWPNVNKNLLDVHGKYPEDNASEIVFVDCDALSSYQGSRVVRNNVKQIEPWVYDSEYAIKAPVFGR